MSGIGHNSLAGVALKDIRRKLAPFARRKRQFLKAAAKVTIRDRADAGAAADLIGLARDVRNMVDSDRKDIAGPHAEAVRAVNDRTREFWGPVDDAMEAVQGKLTDFARDEDARIKAQRAEQEEEMARRAAAVAPAQVVAVQPPPSARMTAPARPPKKQSFRGDYGRQAIVTEADEIEIVDWRQLPDLVMQAADVQEAIRKVVRPLLKQKIAIPGLNVTKAINTSVRK